jgi:formate-dependent nitrite reductase membrane component NrfD
MSDPRPPANGQAGLAPRVTPYGRRAVEVLGSMPPDVRLPTYYDRPALKPTDWRWLIVSYLFVGGLAGAAQLIAGVVDVVGDPRDRRLVSAGRYLALLGALISPVLLIADLKTPSRWYNMLRVYRGTSPMSIGSWTLAAFGTMSGLAALGQLAADLLGLRGGRRLARAAGLPAAASGALLATYTGSLLAATSTPLWAVGYRLLPPLFGMSGTATATAALSLVLHRAGAPSSTHRRLERLALVVSLSELLLTRRLDALWSQRQLAAPLDEPPLSLAYRGGALGLGILTPLAVHLLQALTGRELRTASTLASFAALAGGYSQRAVLLLAGKRSAERATDAFRFAQP